MKTAWRNRLQGVQTVLHLMASMAAFSLSSAYALQSLLQADTTTFAEWLVLGAVALTFVVYDHSALQARP